MLNGTVTGRVLQVTGQYDEGSRKWITFNFEQVQWNGNQEISSVCVGYAPDTRRKLLDKCADNKWKFIGSFNHVWAAALSDPHSGRDYNTVGFRFSWIDLP